MRLMEFQGPTSRALTVVAGDLQLKLGRLARIGGPGRIYEVGDDGDELGAVYTIDGTMTGFGLTWQKHLQAMGVSKVYVWHEFDVNRSPDFYLTLPTTGDIQNMISTIAKWILHPTVGAIEVLDEEVIDEDDDFGISKKRCSPEEFIRYAREMYPESCHNLSIVDLGKISTKYKVQIPTSLRNDPSLKRGPHVWDLSGNTTARDIDYDHASQELGADVIPHPENDDPDLTAIKDLEKIKTVNTLINKGRKMFLMGHTKSGKIFRVPGVDKMVAQLQRMMEREIEAAGGGDNDQNMAEQYDMLKDKVRLVAGNRSAFVKSLLITGGPSSGKSYSVMQTIKELGLHSKDYMIKKGYITTTALWKTLVENVDGLVIFDDCDSVVDDKSAVNILKGALDTDPVREISYDARGTINTAVMDPEERDMVVNAIARILRGKPLESDMAMFEKYLKKAKKKPARDRDDDEDSDDYDADDIFSDDADDGIDHEKLFELQSYFARHLPNKIDFKGRIIFISNMDESEWDSAIITRAFSINLNFASGEMLDYIDNIKGNIIAPAITDEEKQEVIDYLRELWQTGKLKRQVNFRLVQQCFDLRLTSNWKKMMSML